MSKVIFLKKMLPSAEFRGLRELGNRPGSLPSPKLNESCCHLERSLAGFIGQTESKELRLLLHLLPVAGNPNGLSLKGHSLSNLPSAQSNGAAMAPPILKGTGFNPYI